MRPTGGLRLLRSRQSTCRRCLPRLLARGCGQANKFAGLEIVENFVPAGGLNVVAFVHDDDVEIVRRVIFEGGT